MNENKIYKCGICGKEYFTPLERAKCEIACAEKQEAENKRKEKLRLLEERNTRKEDIKNKIKRVENLVSELNEMIDTYNSDYDENINKYSMHTIPYFTEDGFSNLEKIFRGWL